jgi:hypothetical protein
MGLGMVLGMVLAGIGKRRGEPQRIAMTRSLVVAMGLALATAVTLPHAALAQSPFPPAPQQSSPFPPAPQQAQSPAATQQSSPFPPAPQQSTFPAAPQQSVFPSGPMQGGPPMGGPPPQAGICASFPKLRDEAKAKADAVSAVGKKHGDRKDMCAAVQSFTAAEDKVVKFLEDNKKGCGVPDQAVAQAKAMHANTIKFRDSVCSDGPKAKVPTLSDAIGAPPAETGTNTKTGRGTLDTLTGNPLAK